MLDQEIIDLVSSKLPKLQSDALVERLTKIDSLEHELARCQASLLLATKNYEGTLEANQELQAVLSQHRKLEEREAACSKRENKLEVELLKKELQMSQQSKQELFSLADTVFKNKHITYATQGYTPVKDQSGYVSQHSFNSTTKVEEG